LIPRIISGIYGLLFLNVMANLASDAIVLLRSLYRIILLPSDSANGDRINGVYSLTTKKKQ